MRRVEIFDFRDGSLGLSCGDAGMESDLVFASGAMTGDPVLEKQREILEWIASKVNGEPQVPFVSTRPLGFISFDFTRIQEDERS